MRKFYSVGFGLLLFFDTLAQCSFKLTAIQSGAFQLDWDWFRDVFTNKWIYVSGCSYILTFFTWISLLKKAPVGSAFAASHMEIISVMIASFFLFDEAITIEKLLGTFLILSGIFFLATAENKLNNFHFVTAKKQ